MLQTETLRVAPPADVQSLTANQIRGFWAAWGGWALDGMDSFIYALVLTPAITELLPRSGVAATPANVVYYGTILLALFMIGWGLSMLWGPFADRFGRVRALMLTILCYSLFSAASSPTSGSSVRAGCSRASASAGSGRSAGSSSPKSGPRNGERWEPATCTPATTSDFSSLRLPTT